MIFSAYLSPLLAEQEACLHEAFLRVKQTKSLAEKLRFLDNGDGEITLMEFIDGASRLRGSAKAIDVWRLETKLEARQRNDHMLISA